LPGLWRVFLISWGDISTLLNAMLVWHTRWPWHDFVRLDLKNLVMSEILIFLTALILGYICLAILVIFLARLFFPFEQDLKKGRMIRKKYKVKAIRHESTGS